MNPSITDEHLKYFLEIAESSKAFKAPYTFDDAEIGPVAPSSPQDFEDVGVLILAKSSTQMSPVYRNHILF